LERANVEFVRLDNSGLVDLNHLQDLLSIPAKLVAVCQVSNVTGNIQPVSAICRLARAHGALSLVDAAQAVGHIPVNVKELSCDFLAFSSHKAFGPSGVGGLYIRQDSQHLVKNFRYGGGMVDQVSADSIRYKTGLARFEAGTPNIEGVIGTGAAFDFITTISLAMIEQHNRYLDNYALAQLKKIDYLTFPFIASANRVPIITFNIERNINIHLLSSILSDNYGIAINSGYQCNQKLYREAGLQGGIRVSLHMYNTTVEIDELIFAITEIFR
jgi:cysteine desulfurase/selenocysteine lyase